MSFGTLGASLNRLGGMGSSANALLGFIPGASADFRFDAETYLASRQRYPAFTDIPGATISGGVNGTVVRDGVIVRTTALDDDFTGYADQAAAVAAGFVPSGATPPTFDAVDNQWDFPGVDFVFLNFASAASLVDGAAYVITATWSGSTAGSLRVQYGATNAGQVAHSEGEISAQITWAAGSFIRLQSVGAFDGSIDSITIRRADTLPRIGDDGLLVEGEATRLTTYPQDQTDWNSVGALTTTLDVVDGFERRRVASGGASWHRQERELSEALAGGEVRWVRARYELGTSGKVRVVYRNSTASTETGVYGTPDNLAIFANAGALSGLQSIDLGSGVYEVVFAVTVAQASTNSRVGIGPESTVVGEDVIVHGAQLTDAPSSWIISDPSGTPTRTADSVTLTDLDALGLTSAVLSGGYTVVVEGVVNDDSAASGEIVTVWGGGTTDAVRLHVPSEATGVRLRVNYGGVGQADLNQEPYVLGQVFRMAARVSPDNFGLSFDGASAVTDTSGTVPDALTIRVGAFASATPSTEIRRLTIIPRAVSDAELQALSS